MKLNLDIQPKLINDPVLRHFLEVCRNNFYELGAALAGVVPSGNNPDIITYITNNVSANLLDYLYLPGRQLTQVLNAPRDPSADTLTLHRRNGQFGNDIIVYDYPAASSSDISFYVSSGQVFAKAIDVRGSFAGTPQAVLYPDHLELNQSFAAGTPGFITTFGADLYLQTGALGVYTKHIRMTRSAHEVLVNPDKNANAASNRLIVYGTAAQAGKYIHCETSAGATQFDVLSTGVAVSRGDNWLGSTSGTLSHLAAAITTNYTLTWPSATADGLIRNTAGVLSFDNTVLTSSDFSDAVFRVHDDGDPTKLMAWQLSGLTTLTTRTYTPPNADCSLAGLEVSNAFTKSMSISSTDNNRTLGLFCGPAQSAALLEMYDEFGDLASYFSHGGGLRIGDTAGEGPLTIYLGPIANNTGVAINVDNLTTGIVTWSFPNATDTFVGNTNTASLNNKTLSTSCLAHSNVAGTGFYIRDSTGSTKRIYWDLHGAAGNNLFRLQTTTARTYDWPNASCVMATDMNIVLDSANALVINTSGQLILTL